MRMREQRDFSYYKLDPLINERAFTEHVRRLAIEGKWLYYHTQDSRRSAPGFPDFVLVRKGELIFAELKVGKGKVSPEQATWLDALRVMVGHSLKSTVSGVEVYEWRPEQFEQVARRLLDEAPE